MTNHEHDLLKVENLKVYYPIVSGIMRHTVGHVKALDGVNIDLKKGETLGIVGETGCGKSTLGRAILRLIEPTDGSVLFNGRDIFAMDAKTLRHFRKDAQIIFQDPFASLNPRKSIRDSIGEALIYHGLVNNRSEQKERVAEILSLVGMPADAMHRYPHEFSGGQQQRICIGRAIALRPSMIVCDEAASALDVSVQAQILNLLQELKQTLSLSYLFISHDLSLIRYLCDRVVVLYLGKVMETGSVNEIFSNPRHPYTQALLSAVPKNHPKEIKIRIPLVGDIPSARNPPSGCPFRTRCPYAQPICSVTPPKKFAKTSLPEKVPHEYHCILGSSDE